MESLRAQHNDIEASVGEIVTGRLCGSPAPDADTDPMAAMPILLQGIERLHATLTLLQCARCFTDVPRVVPRGAELLDHLRTEGDALLGDLIALTHAYAECASGEPPWRMIG